MNETVRESILRSISQLQQNQERSDNLAATHQPEEPNPAAPALDFARNFSGGGLQRALDLPNNFIGKSLQNNDNQAVMPGLGMAWNWRKRMVEPMPGFPLAAKSGPWVDPTLTSKAVDLYNKGRTFDEIGEELGLTKNQIAGRIKRINDHPSVQAGLKEGKTFAQIANELGITRSAVAGRVDRLRGYNREIRAARAAGKEVPTTRGTPSMPQPNLPPAEDIDPNDLAEFLNIFKPK